MTEKEKLQELLEKLVQAVYVATKEGLGAATPEYVPYL